MKRTGFALSYALLICAAPAPAQELTQQLDALVAAYPDHLARHDGKSIIWRDGTVMPVGDAAAKRPLQEMLRNATVADQLRMPYRAGRANEPPARDDDPGRVRNSAFFAKMYGDCKKGEVAKRMVSITWMPKSWGKKVSVTSVNGVPEKLRAISAELDEIPASIKKAAFPIAGVYNCRPVADTGQPSVHSYAAAIDLNTAFSDYWFWQKAKDPIPYRNRMPHEIVTIFEKHGFIWGGKWYHYDTMHFEYRPELLR